MTSLSTAALWFDSDIASHSKTGRKSVGVRWMRLSLNGESIAIDKLLETRPFPSAAKVLLLMPVWAEVFGPDQSCSISLNPISMTRISACVPLHLL